MARHEQYIGDIKSEEGFYIGDICYALLEDVYDLIWGEKNGYQDGQFFDPGTEYSFAVGSTKYGDGSYVGSNGFHYPVDAGVIGIVPLELVDMEMFEDSAGTIYEVPGTARYEFEDGEFTFVLPDNTRIYIDTYAEEDEDEDEDFNE